MALMEAVLMAAAGFLPAAPVEETVLTMEEALRLARERAPAVLIARARVEEARAAAAGASILLQENPWIRAAAGRREKPGADYGDLAVEVVQELELGGARAARRDAAGAVLSAETARSEETTRLALREVSAAFLRCLHATRAVALRQEAAGLAEETLRVARARYESGDVAVLDVNVARTALARARAEAAAAAAGREEHLGRLRQLLGMEAGGGPAVTGGGPAVTGELDPGGGLRLEDLTAQALQRADLRALDQEIARAEAEARLGDAGRWPGLEAGVQYEREEDATVVRGLIGFTLPAFQRAQGPRAEARARAARLRLEREALGRAVAVEVAAAFEAHHLRLEAARELEQEALPMLVENEALVARSYESGQISLVDLMVIRAEVLQTRLEHLDRFLEAALSRVELESAAGVLR